MKIKYYLNISCLLLVIFNHSCLCTKDKCTEPYYYGYDKTNLNLIGITGKDSSQAYIELFYSKDSNGQNITVHEWVKPPYLFGEHKINVKTITSASLPVGCKMVKNFLYDYNEGGDSYLKIINHSNSPLEIFIIEPIETKLISEGICKDKNYPAENSQFCLKTLETYPIPVYKKAPLYYLLKPEKIVDKGDVIFDSRIYLDGQKPSLQNYISINKNKVGEIFLDKKYTITDIMAMFRAEYNNSKDTILYDGYINIEWTKYSQNKRLFIKNQEYKNNPLYEKINNKNFLNDYIKDNEKANWNDWSDNNVQLGNFKVSGRCEYYKLIPANGTFYSLRENPIVSQSLYMYR